MLGAPSRKCRLLAFATVSLNSGVPDPKMQNTEHELKREKRIPHVQPKHSGNAGNPHSPCLQILDFFFDLGHGDRSQSRLLQRNVKRGQLCLFDLSPYGYLLFSLLTGLPVKHQNLLDRGRGY
jgi:hypothetical protein